MLSNNLPEYSYEKDNTIIIKAPAKINLGLDVKSKRPDGYHELEMVMQTISLFDIVSIQITHDRIIHLSSNIPNLPLGEDSPVHKAVMLFYAKCMQNFSGVKIDIQKSIPIMAGLGGASADIAAVIIGLNAIESRNFSIEELKQLGVKLGADVPFCIEGGTSFVTGIGEKIVPIEPFPNCFIVLSKPNIGVSTKEAFNSYDNHPLKVTADVKKLVSYIALGDLKGSCGAMSNVFEAVSAPPESIKLIDVLKKSGALTAHMTGTGSAVFGIFDNEQKALSVAEKIKTVYNDTFVVTPIGYGSQVELSNLR